MAIRYDNALKMDLARTVRNFNAKVKRLEKLDRDLDLPELASVSELKKKYTNRKDLKRELSNLKLFGKRGIEESFTTKGGVNISKYKYEVLKRESRRTKALISRELKRRETTKIKTFGVEEIVTYAEIGERSYLNLKARRNALEKDISRLDKAGLKRYSDLVAKSISKRNYDFNNLQYNWSNEMLMPVAYMSGYDMSKLEVVSKKIASLKETQFLNLFNDEEVMKSLIDDYKDLKNGTASDEDIEDIHNRLDKLVEDIDIILEDYV